METAWLRFENVLIGTGYVLEEVDTPIRYVVPDSPDSHHRVERSYSQERE